MKPISKVIIISQLVLKTHNFRSEKVENNIIQTNVLPTEVVTTHDEGAVTAYCNGSNPNAINPDDFILLQDLSGNDCRVYRIK